MPNSHFRGLGLTCKRCLHVTGDPAKGTTSFFEYNGILYLLCFFVGLCNVSSDHRHVACKSMNRIYISLLEFCTN